MRNETKQLFYKYVTTPIARVLDAINLPKRIKLAKMRRKLALQNKHDYIEQTAKILLETELQEKLNEGMIPNPLALPIIISNKIDLATEMFYEKKQNGYFDELNCMIKNDEELTIS